jgi:hypothetical protein
MILNQLTVKYAKLALQGSSIKKDSPEQITANCPMCGDKKHRFSVSAVKDDVGVVGCFNAGCILENGMPFPAFLKMHDENLYNQYRKEKFDSNLGVLKTDKKPVDLNHLLKIAQIARMAKEKSKKILNLQKPQEVKKPKRGILGNINLPEVFGNLEKLPDIPEAVQYLEKRKIPEEIYKHYFFSKDKFIKVLDKTYFVENYIFIPIIQENKLKGFYTRSINEKRFSTILFPNADKYWCSDFKIQQGVRYYIFEGIFDAISSGLDRTIAMLTADLSDEVLEELENPSPVFVFDNDKTGVKKAIRILQKGYEVFVWPNEWSEFKDINEVLQKHIEIFKDIEDTQKYIKQVIENNIKSGINAEVMLKMKNL